MPFDIKSAVKWLEDHEGEQLALLKELTAIPAPSNHEERRAEFIKKWLELHGARGVEVDSVLNVLLPMGVDAKNSFHVYMAHTDTVFPEGTPLEVVERDGMLCAPGVGDDTANAVGMMMIVRCLIEMDAAPKEPVLFVWNSGEEGLGNLKGVRRVMETYGHRVLELVSFDGQYKSIVSRAVGSERWRVTAQTVGGHSYGAFGNPNAIHHLAKLVSKLYEQKVPQKDGTKTTFNVGTIEGGTSVNTIAQNASMLYEYRSDDRDALEQMRKQFQVEVALADTIDAKIDVELLGQRPCTGDVAPAAHKALIDRLTAAIREVGDWDVPLRSGSTDANIPLSMGIPAATFGMYLGRGAHTREEAIERASLLPGIKVGMHTIAKHF